METRVKTPNQYRALRNTKAQALEAKIDSAIELSAAFGDAAITIGTHGYNAATIEQVISDYRKAGWTVELVPDSRDGDFIKLEMP
jgi:hypothetical protein